MAAVTGPAIGASFSPSFSPAYDNLSAAPSDERSTRSAQVRTLTPAASSPQDFRRRRLMHGRRTLEQRVLESRQTETKTSEKLAKLATTSKVMTPSPPPAPAPTPALAPLSSSPTMSGSWRRPGRGERWKPAGGEVEAGGRRGLTTMTEKMTARVSQRAGAGTVASGNASKSGGGGGTTTAVATVATVAAPHSLSYLARLGRRAAASTPSPTRQRPLALAQKQGRGLRHGGAQDKAQVQAEVKKTESLQYLRVLSRRRQQEHGVATLAAAAPMPAPASASVPASPAAMRSVTAARRSAGRWAAATSTAQAPTIVVPLEAALTSEPPNFSSPQRRTLTARKESSRRRSTSVPTPMLRLSSSTSPSPAVALVVAPGGGIGRGSGDLALYDLVSFSLSLSLKAGEVGVGERGGLSCAQNRAYPLSSLT